eukprot:gene7393-8804_t
MCESMSREVPELQILELHFSSLNVSVSTNIEVQTTLQNGHTTWGESARSTPGRAVPQEVDVVVVGAGLGGLCCGALLAKYGLSVAVLESHTVAGGVAHPFERNGYFFDSGPSFYSGLSDPKGTSANALRQVLDVLGESMGCIHTYDKWTCYIPESDLKGPFVCSTNREEYRQQLEKFAGSQAVAEFDQLERLFEPVNRLTVSAPFAAFRWDPAAAISFSRYLKGFFDCGALDNGGALLRQMSGMLGDLMEGVVTDPFLKKWLDLECFVITGQLANRSPIPEMAFMYRERHKSGAVLDYCHSAQYIAALVRGLEKFGGSLHLGAHVDEVLVDGGRAAGVRLKSGNVIRAKKAVVSNASCWDTLKLLPQGALPERAMRDTAATPETKSFVHLHLGISADGLPPPEELGIHHLVVQDWALGVDGSQNIINISIPTVLDPSLAPAGKHVVHAYTAGNESYDNWENMKRGTPEYEALKEERSECLWKALENVIPDIRDRAEVRLVGTPLTHARFNRRHRGSYGPALTEFPGPKTPLPGLYACGDSTFPGIGVPSACASGMFCANSLVPIWDHVKFIDELEALANGN